MYETESSRVQMNPRALAVRSLNTINIPDRKLQALLLGNVSREYRSQKMPTTTVRTSHKSTAAVARGAAARHLVRCFISRDLPVRLFRSRTAIHDKLI